MKVAQHLKSAVKGRGFVARLGGDEFVVFLPKMSGQQAINIAECALAPVGQRYGIAGTMVSRSCSIGVAIYEPGDDVNSVLHKADRAAYQGEA